MSDRDIIVLSDVDYEDLIAEMYIDGQFIGVLSQESGFQNLQVELHRGDGQSPLAISYDRLQHLLLKAKERLWELRRQ